MKIYCCYNIFKLFLRESFLKGKDLETLSSFRNNKRSLLIIKKINFMSQRNSLGI